MMWRSDRIVLNLSSRWDFIMMQNLVMILNLGFDYCGKMLYGGMQGHLLRNMVYKLGFLNNLMRVSWLVVKLKLERLVGDQCSGGFGYVMPG